MSNQVKVKDQLVRKVNLSKHATTNKKVRLTPSKAGVPKKKFNLIRKDNNVYEFTDITDVKPIVPA